MRNSNSFNNTAALGIGLSEEDNKKFMQNQALEHFRGQLRVHRGLADKNSAAVKAQGFKKS